MGYNHCYAIFGIDTKNNADPADDEVVLGNPWGGAYTVQVKFVDLQTYFRFLYITE